MVWNYKHIWGVQLEFRKRGQIKYEEFWIGERELYTKENYKIDHVFFSRSN